MKYISIDLETTGLDSNNHQILEFAAIIEDTNNKLSFDEIPKFRAIIEHEMIVGTPFAINMNRKLIEILSNKNLILDYTKNHNIENLTSINTTSNNLLKRFFVFLSENGIDKSNVVVAGKNFNRFDLRFLEKLDNFGYFGIHRRVLDPTNYFISYNDDDIPPSLEECLKRANLVNNHPHNALYDAWAVIELLRTKY